MALKSRLRNILGRSQLPAGGNSVEGALESDRHPHQNPPPTILSLILDGLWARGRVRRVGVGSVWATAHRAEFELSRFTITTRPAANLMRVHRFGLFDRPDALIYKNRMRSRPGAIPSKIPSR